MQDSFRYAQQISVVGTPGSGKTTLARRIAQQLQIPHVELDALHWEPDWTAASDQVFRDRATKALEGDRWVVDGNYNKIRDLVWSRADTVVFLRNIFTICTTDRRLVVKSQQIIGIARMSPSMGRRHCPLPSHLRIEL